MCVCGVCVCVCMCVCVCVCVCAYEYFSFCGERENSFCRWVAACNLLTQYVSRYDDGDVVWEPETALLSEDEDDDSVT